MGKRQKQQEQWAVRIIGTADVPPESLLANPANWTEHSAEQQNAMRDALGGGENKGLGWLDTVLVNKRTSELWPDGDRNVETVVDGHMRIALAMRHNQKTVPVRYCDLTPEEERLALLTINPIAAMVKASAERLDEAMRDVQVESKAVQDMLANLLTNKEGYMPVLPEQYAEIDDQLAELDGFNEVNISIVIPAKYKEEVVEWLANGERHSAPGMGKGVLRRCGLL